MRFPRAFAFLSSLSKEGILAWLMEYPIGQVAMEALEAKLERE